jgi:hypothetical protein
VDDGHFTPVVLHDPDAVVHVVAAELISRASSQVSIFVEGLDDVELASVALAAVIYVFSRAFAS